MSFVVCVFSIFMYSKWHNTTLNFPLKSYANRQYIFSGNVIHFMKLAMIAYFMVCVKTIGVNTVFSIQKYAKHKIAGICNEILHELRCMGFIRIRFGFIDVVRDNFCFGNYDGMGDNSTRERELLALVIPVLIANNFIANNLYKADLRYLIGLIFMHGVTTIPMLRSVNMNH